MSVRECDDGYFYAVDLKRFAGTLGIAVGNLRKFEVEGLITDLRNDPAHRDMTNDEIQQASQWLKNSLALKRMRSIKLRDWIDAHLHMIQAQP
ncbi:hypothetical protein ACGE24_04155 [Corynebacterium kroppenstedtii]|uniref:hypothetical protein n=1 Tax=Corynebacterium sp. PCR 32 TaxID=3351342 RepID=UPI0030AFE26A